MLLKDTTSWLQAAYNKWDYPASKEYLMQLETFDLLAIVNSKRKPKPVKRPFKTKDEQKKQYLNGKYGNTKGIQQSKVRDFLAQLGHKPQGE